jgi:hypothetical protein
MQEILFEDKIKCNKYKGRIYVFLTSKEIILKKKKYIFFGEYIEIKKYQIRDIKENNTRTLIRIIENSIDIIFINDSIKLDFYNNESAKKFYDILIEQKKNDTFVNRSLYKMKNITEEDVKNGIKYIVKTVGLVALLVHSVKSVVNDGKTIKDEGKEVIKKLLKRK